MTPVAVSSPSVAAPRKAFQIPSLDGLRAVSFFIVFMGHATTIKLIPGELGLTVFFFLSGYLITTLLRLEVDQTGGINFRDFYLRRVLRIFPPFYIVLGLGCALTLTHVLDNTLWPQAVLAQTFQLTNYWIVFHGWWNGMAPGSWIFWSLAVEEHFYLVFPLIYLLMRRRGLTARQQMQFLLGLCLAVLVWRFVLVLGFHAVKDRIYPATDTRLDGILFGCLLAVYGNPALDPAGTSERNLKSFWLPVAFAALAVSFVGGKFLPWFDQTIRYTIQSAALFPIFIIAIRFPKWGAFRWLNLSWVRFIGLLSYSLYLMHTTVLYALHLRTHWPKPVVSVAALVICLLLASLIYYFVEKPCARLRKRLSHIISARGQAKVSPGKDNGDDDLPGNGASLEAVASVPEPQTRSRRVARNLLATLGTQLASWGMTFAVTFFLPRYVGDDGLGKLAVATSFIALFGVVVPLGTSTVLIKEIARDRARTGELLSAVLLLRLPVGLLMAALAVGSVYLLGYPPVIQTLVFVSALGMLTFTVNDALGAALQGQENMPRQSVGILVDKFLFSVLSIGLLLHFRYAIHSRLWMLVAVSLCTGLVSLLFNLSAFRSLLPTLCLPRRSSLRQVAIAGLPFMGWTVFQTLYGQTDPIILSLMSNDRTVGWYNAAFRLIGTAFFLPTALTTALLPTLSRLHTENPAEYRQLARRMLILVILCGVPISLVMLLLPERLITLMHYPAAFQNSVPVLRVGGIGVLLWFGGSVLGTLIFASDGQARMFRVSIWATVIGVPLCFLGSFLANRFLHNGAIGAISSDALLEVYLIWAYLRLLPKGTFDSESLRGVGLCFAAALPMAAALALLAAQGWGLWSLPPGIALYLIFCVVLGCLRPRDLDMARQVFARKAG
jgi:peptidoglycan/LPS O-acetylase OafA/YrhL/O-antigen/teichoic acid export membrane protein